MYSDVSAVSLRGGEGVAGWPSKIEGTLWLDQPPKCQPARLLFPHPLTPLTWVWAAA